jgi:glyoxylase-like metal-dependent hydrolase (beta-lactamase superfamily II)
MRNISELPAGIMVLERGWLSSNNIVFTGGYRTALVDSGYSTHAAQTVALVRGVLRDRPLDRLVNTHLHSDHCGGNAALQAEYPDVQTRIPPGQAQYVRDWDPVALTYVPTGQECPRFRIEGLLQPGATINLGDLSWQIHASPGHDPHSVVMFEPGSRTLISADALWENGFGIVFQELEGDHAFEEVARTLDMIERLDPLIVIPGHGKVFTNVSQAIGAARRRLDSFVEDPGRHAAHASKVLLKFKLLELERLRLPDFVEWARATPYFAMVHRRWFAGISLQEWIEQLVDSLVRAGAARRDGEYVMNE